MIFNWIQYSPITYGEYEYPDWGIGIGWLLASLSLVCIPIGIVKSIYEAEGKNFFQVNSPNQIVTSNHLCFSFA
jgi:solute carrier family 6 GABA transporter-like protein 6/8/11/12/13